MSSWYFSKSRASYAFLFKQPNLASQTSINRSIRIIIIAFLLKNILR